MISEEEISHFLKRHPGRGYCNFCISVETGIGVAEVSSITNLMSLFPGEFEHRPQRCSRCRNDQLMVTTARQAA